MEAVRTCLGCRQRASRSELVRLVARDGRVVVDTAARLPGRGAWVHPAPGCVAAVIRRSALGRALRVTGALDATELTTYEAVLEEQAERHMDN